ncbi:MAG: RNA methyltransferase [Eubacteriales bacterium]|nr:RNA methyltransferase [Eubacteriales bacterium]
MAETISSAQNPFAQGLKKLGDKKHREAQRLLLAEGPKLVEEALREGLRPAQALVSAERAEELRGQIAALEAQGAQVRICPENVLKAVSETRTPQGVCASFGWPKPLAQGEEPALLVALDGVQDPGNVGGIWRTADAAGFGGVLFSEGCADATSPKVVRSAMGSAFRLPARSCADLAAELVQLRERGYHVLVTALDGEDFFSGMPAPGEKAVLVIGSEGHGVRRTTREAATGALRLPMRGGAESLNANVAAGIMLYALSFGLRPR